MSSVRGENQPSLFGDLPKEVLTERKVIQDADILCLDIATKTGWCLGNSSGQFYSGTWNLTPKTNEHEDARIWKFMVKISDILERHKIKLVAFELPIVYKSKKRRPNFVSFELLGVMKLLCMEFKVKRKGYQSAKLKLFATGKGNAVKEDMIDACKAKYKITPMDHNEADAVHLYNMVFNEIRNG